MSEQNNQPAGAEGAAHPPAMILKKEAPIGEVTVPEGVFVQCPLREFKLRAAVKCEGCEYFHGLADRFPGGEQKFEDRYMVRCGGPVSRRLARIDMASD